MKKKIKPVPVFLLALAFSVAWACYSFSQISGTLAGQQVPDTLRARLNLYKAKDSLAPWLNSCGIFIARAPQEHFFLYQWADTTLWRIPARDSQECTAYFSYLLYHGYDALKIKGDVAQSMDCYEQALRFYQSAHTFIRQDSSELAAYLLKPLGNVYTRMGDYKSALLIHRINRKIAEREQDTLALASTLGNMAVAARWQDSLQLARSYISAGLQLAPQQSRPFAFLHSIAAEVALCDSLPEEAARHNRMALRQYRVLSREPGRQQLPALEGLVASIGTEADIYLVSKQAGPAIQSCREALRVLEQFFPGSHNREKAIARKRLADMLFVQQQYEAAEQQYAAALQQLLPLYKGGPGFPEQQQLFPDNTIIDAISGKSACMARMGADSMALEGLMLAAALDQKIRLRFQSETAKLEQLVHSRKRTETILELATKLYRQQQDKRYLLIMLQQIERSKAQVLMEQWARNDAGNDDTTVQEKGKLLAKIGYYRRVLAGLPDQDPEYTYFASRLREQEYALSLLDVKGYHNNEHILSHVDSSGPQGWLEALPADVVALEYFAGNRHIYLLTLEQGRVASLSVTDSAALWKGQIQQYLNRYFYTGPEKIQDEPEAFCAASVLLYRHLIPDIRWKRFSKCMVIPDDYLYHVPFDALQDPSGPKSRQAGKWPYLLRKIAVQHSFSLQLWLLESERQRNTVKEPVKTGVEGFFVADFKAPFPALPEVHAEYRQLRHGICDQAYLNKAATKRQLLHSLEQNNIVHISTHSVERGRDRTPALILGDSLMYAWELSGRFPAAPLVVLNTCRSAGGLLQEGEGVISMARYLAAAGFKGVVASLWNVNDKSGAALTSEFYNALSRHPDPGLALHKAKAEWLDNPEVPSADKIPYYWSGFIYSGVDQHISLKQHHSFDTRIGLLLSLLFAVCLLWVIRQLRKRRPFI